MKRDGMQRQDIAHKISTIIADQLSIEPDQVSEQSTLDGLGLDSLDRVEMLMSIEEAFDIEIDDEQAMKYKTVGDIIDGLHHYLSR